MNTNDVLKILNGITNPKNSKSSALPAPLVSTASKSRSGISLQKSVQQYTEKLKSAGYFADAQLPDGTPNSDLQKAEMLLEVIYDMIKYESKLEVAFKPGDIIISANGSAGPIPCSVVGQNTNFPSGSATIS